MPMPRRLHFGGYQVDVLETLDRWYGADYQYIKAGALKEICTSFGSMNLRPNGN